MNFNFFKAAAFVVGLLLVGIWQTTAQIPDNVSAKGVNLQYFDLTPVIVLIVAHAADPGPGGHIIAKQFHMYTFGPGGANDIDVTLAAPECFFDYDQ